MAGHTVIAAWALGGPHGGLELANDWTYKVSIDVFPGTSTLTFTDPDTYPLVLDNLVARTGHLLECQPSRWSSTSSYRATSTAQEGGRMRLGLEQ